MTLVDGVTTNTSILKVGEIRIPILGTKGKTIEVNSGNSFINSVEGTIKIISDSNVTFTDGSTVLSTTKNNKITKSINSDDSFEISVTNKGRIGYLLLNKEFNIDPNFDLTKLYYLTDLRGFDANVEFKINDINELLRTSKNLKSLYVPSAAFNVKLVPKSVTSLIMTGNKYVTGTIAELSGYKLGKDWAQVINQTSITGDLADVPSDVFYINTPLPAVTWTKGKRANATFLAINSTENVEGFASKTDIDNMFIDQATCNYIVDSSIDSHGGAISKINILCTEDYIPSDEAKAAIRNIYEKGITSIIVNNNSMEQYK